MSKQQQLNDFATNNSGETFRTADICIAVDCSLPTVLNFIKKNPNLFEKTGHGIYKVLSSTQQMVAGESAYAASSVDVAEPVHEEMTTVSEVTSIPVYNPTTPRPTFDW